MENRFCFVGIVKNEAHVIRRCIDSIANIATCYLINDNGSTDGTSEIITSYMREKNIPGEILYEPWQNYGYNRSYVMEHAYTHGKARGAKYIIWHDADEVFIKDKNDPTSYLTREDADELYNWLEQQPEPMTYINTWYNTLVYRRWNIVRNNQLYKWMSPKHEWLNATVDNRSNRYDKFILLARQEGGASRDPNRCKKDVAMYFKYFDDMGGYQNCPREVFYLAQEYESVDKEKAIEYYVLKTTLTNNWIEETYIAYLRLGRLCDVESDKVKWWQAGFELIPDRLECIYEIMELYHKKNDLTTALKWAVLASENRTLNDEHLFLEHESYTYHFDLDYSLVAYYAGKYQLANDINQRNMLRNPTSPHLELMKSNQKFIDDKLQETGLIKMYPMVHAQIIKALEQLAVTHSNKANYHPTLIVIDNFYPNPKDVIDIATGAIADDRLNYMGLWTKSFATDELKARFEEVLGKQITKWDNDYNGSFWHLGDITAKLTNSYGYCAIVYLTPEPSVDYETIFYETGTDDIVDIFSNNYNRCIIFQGDRTHRISNGLSNDILLLQVFYFDVV